jgi:hypothetical protein
LPGKSCESRSVSSKELPAALAIAAEGFARYLQA